MLREFLMGTGAMLVIHDDASRCIGMM